MQLVRCSKREKCISGEPRRSIQRMRCPKQPRTFATGTIFLPLATGQASQTLILTVCRCRTPHRKVSRTYTSTAPTNIPTARTKQSPENRPNQPQSETSLCKHQRIHSRRTTEDTRVARFTSANLQTENTAFGPEGHDRERTETGDLHKRMR